jgi:hypothetical protein
MRCWCGPGVVSGTIASQDNTPCAESEELSSADGPRAAIKGDFRLARIGSRRARPREHRRPPQLRGRRARARASDVDRIDPPGRKFQGRRASISTGGRERPAGERCMGAGDCRPCVLHRPQGRHPNLAHLLRRFTSFRKVALAEPGRRPVPSEVHAPPTASPRVTLGLESAATSETTSLESASEKTARRNRGDLSLEVQLHA